MPEHSKLTRGGRERMIAEAAYFKAERRGFNGGDPVRDWCEAEAEVDARLRALEEGRIVERIEQSLDAASKRVTAVRRKLARLSTEARAEWERDLEKLVVLRSTLKPKLAELRDQGERASRRLRDQAERARSEIAELVQRLENKAKH